MTKRKDITEERQKKRLLWLSRTIQVTGYDEETVTRLLSTPRTQSLRVNSLKPGFTTTGLQPVEWCSGGFELPHEYVKDEQAVSDGQIYIQNAASWLPVLALDPKPQDIILDVCAAPGGKASYIQAITANQSKLTCNDNSKPRLLKLQRNMERLGAEASYALADATRLSKKFEPETFDKILLDAPCSGEGLMTLDDMKLFDSWSVAHIRRLSGLQKKILSESWQLLKPGGTLVYSTCTMAPEENEAVLDYFLRKHEDARLEPVDFPLENRIPALSEWNNKPFTNNLSYCLRLEPSKLTEAFFVAKLIKQ
jgi:16S rRNA C967 or C1407 C5-methylase (RsmB/RsmF family)